MTWWELGLAVFGWTLLCFGLFHLGRLWERDHPWSPRPMTEDRFESWLIEQEKAEAENRYQRSLDPVLRLWRGPYDQDNEDVFHGPHRRG